MPITDIVTVSRASGGSYFDANGVMKWAANNQWRRDYDPVTKQPLGVLIEEQRTNLQPSSENFSTHWLVSNLTTSNPGELFPTGQIATKFSEDAVNTAHRIRSGGLSGISSGVTIVSSIFAKAAERSLLQIGWGSGATGIGPGYCNFDLTTGAVTVAGSGASGQIIPCGGGWYRCIAIFTLTGDGSTSQVYYSLLDNPTSGRLPSHQGVEGMGLYMGGAMTEIGAFPTSYIPTTTAAATRAADRLTVPVDSWFDLSRGTVFAEAETFASLDSTAAYRRHVWALNGPNSNVFEIFYTNVATYNLTGSDATLAAAASIGPPPAQSEFVKSAFAYQAGQIIGSVKASSVVTFTRTLPISITEMIIGDRGASGGRRLNGHIKRIQYWPRRLSNAELQALTA